MYCRVGGRSPGPSAHRGARATAPPAPRLVCRASQPSHYDVLGIDADASDEDVRAAFRRKAKELHPDVNQESGAEAAFMAVKAAYDTLSDPGARRAYDEAHSVHRFGFFRDVDPEAEAAAAGRGDARGANPWDVHRRMWEEEEAEARREARRRGGRPAAPGGAGGGPEGDGGDDDGGFEDPADFLERLSRVMGGSGGGSLSAFQSGRLDPFGQSSSDAWFRRVEQQRASPFGGRPAGGFGRGLDGGGGAGPNPEWAPYRPGDGGDGEGDGWRRPGQRPEWGRRPGGGDDDDEDGGGRGGGGGGGSRPLKGDDFRRGGGGGGGGGFRGW